MSWPTGRTHSVGARRRGLEQFLASVACWTMSLRRWGAWPSSRTGYVAGDGLITREFAPSYWSPTGSSITWPSACTAAACCYWRRPGAIPMSTATAGWLFERWRSSSRSSARLSPVWGDSSKTVGVAEWLGLFCGMLLLGGRVVAFAIATVLARVLPVACGGLLTAESWHRLPLADCGALGRVPSFWARVDHAGMRPDAG